MVVEDGEFKFTGTFTEKKRPHVVTDTRETNEYLNRWIDEGGFRSPSGDFDVFLET